MLGWKRFNRSLVHSTCLSSFPRASCYIFRQRYTYGTAWENCSPCLSVLCTKKRLSPCSSSGGVAYGSPCALRPTERICYRLSSVLKIPLFLLRLSDYVVKSVYVRDLPFEVSDKSIVSVFSTYGKVYSVKSVYHKEFPAICTGTRTFLMSVNDSVPSIVNVHGCECRVWYPGQPAYCSVCRSSGHLPRACPGAVSSPVTWPVSVGRLGGPASSFVLCSSS